VQEVVVQDVKQPTCFECDGEAGIGCLAPALAVDTTGAGDCFNGAYPGETSPLSAVYLEGLVLPRKIRALIDFAAEDVKADIL
jgi:hypothetical protein